MKAQNTKLDDTATEASETPEPAGGSGPSHKSVSLTTGNAQTIGKTAPDRDYDTENTANQEGNHEGNGCTTKNVSAKSGTAATGPSPITAHATSIGPTQEDANKVQSSRTINIALHSEANLLDMTKHVLGVYEQVR